MKKNYFNKIIILYIAFCAFWVSTSRAEDILKEYIDDHALVSENQTLFGMAPHEFSSPDFLEAHKAIQGSHELKKQIESLLEGGEFPQNANPIIWNYLRGGDIIGNGGGIVETKFAYHFNNIPNYIQDCLSSLTACPISKEERFELNAILETFKVKKDDPNRMIFLSSRDYPNFFDGGKIWGARTAKTGFSTDVPIFINADHLYHADQRPAMDDSEIISMLIHETGHQVQIRDHLYLDRLGVTIANYISTRAHIVQRNYGNEEHVLQVFNYQSANLKADASFYYQEKQTDLKPLLWNTLKCWHPDQVIVGYELTNPHWIRSYTEGEVEVFPVGMWATIYCQNPRGRSVFKRDLDIQFDFHFKMNRIRPLIDVQAKIIETY